MKTMTVPLEDEQIERIEEESRRLGIPFVEVVQRAVDNYLGIFHVNGDESEDPFMALVGIGRSETPLSAEEIERVLEEEYPKWIYEDSFSDYLPAPDEAEGSPESEPDQYD
jgi:hypothetical protein